MIYKLTCLWFVSISVVVLAYPEVIGRWQAKAELAFLVEAEKIGLWGE